MVNHKIAKLSGIIKRQIYQIISEEGLDITPTARLTNPSGKPRHPTQRPA